MYFSEDQIIHRFNSISRYSSNTLTYLEEMKWNCAQKTLSLCCTLLGHSISKHPIHFILIPFGISLILSTGYLQMKYLKDAEYLYSMKDSKAVRDRDAMEKLFPFDEVANFDPSRTTRIRDAIFLIIIPKDKGNILRTDIFREIVEIDNFAQNFTIYMNNKHWNYSQICARRNGNCIYNVGLSLLTKIDDYNKGTFKFKYPVDINLDNFKITPYAANLGGVTLDNDDYVQEAKAFRLNYFYHTKTELMDHIVTKWESLFSDYIHNTEFDNITVYKISFRSVENEFGRNTSESISLIGISVVLMLLFSIVTCMSTEWIRSKPWLGLSGFISSLLAVSATFGMLMYCGVEYVDVIIALPFLMIGIGMDDSFVLISAWRRTSPEKSLKRRMGEAYSEAAVSITITSLTNLFSFCFGMVTPFPVVQFFCIYAATAVFFTYVYQITFFGGCMALSGLREEQKLHPFTFRPVKFKENKTSTCEEEPIVIQEDIFMKFFKETIGGLLTKTCSKVIIIALFLINIAVAIWGCSHMKEGMELSDLLHPKTSSYKYIKLNFEYFGEYTGRIHVAINETLNYADPKVQQDIDNLIKNFEATPYIKGGFFTEYWLKYFMLMSKHPMLSYSFRAYNLTDKQDFIDCVHNVFLKFPQTRKLRSDIVFNENYTEIISSRFHFTIHKCDNRDKERELYKHVKEVMRDSKISIIAHCLYFIFNEQMFVVKSISIQTVCVAAVVMMVIFFIFIPNFTCAVCVAVTIVAVEVEAIGYMSLWGVNLDVLSMISLVMCVGFSVNYPAHIAYAFIISNKTSSKENLKASLFAVGMPIFQGSFSTILGIVVLAFVPSYMLQVFLKTIFLIVTFTAIHAMFILPVILSIWDSLWKKIIPKQQPLLQRNFSNNINSCKDLKEKTSEKSNSVPNNSTDNKTEEIWVKRIDF
ncbi:patched domain-containing protein 3-like [Centruroides sculpturatus]|uniref:patched domain-containing protein 3-like n=1 Tax=Centruroides sculpturatus TaxID=218467 RepID=UPI000C6EF221|nr:patched domain-containing protein 3-like [Centruroides sculpturatus]